MTFLDPLRILAVGDIMLGEHPGSLGVGVLSKWMQTRKHPFHYIERFLQGYNVVIGNLECVLSNSTIHSGYLGKSLRAPTTIAQILAKNGFHVLSVANNHSMDHGYDAFEETVNSLLKAGILVCGIKQDPARLEVDISPTNTKKTISFFGASFRPNDTKFNPLYTLIANKHDLETFKLQIHQESKSSNLVVIQCHWGDEFITFPNIKQVQLANELVESGADVIIGHHSHVYQGRLIINNTPVFFSLGNFVSDMKEGYLRRSAVGSILWDGSNISSTTIPIRLDENHRPYLSRKERDIIFNLSVDSICKYAESRKYSEIYPVLLRKVRLKYKFDTFCNLIQNFGIMPRYTVQIILDIFRRLVSV